MTPLKLFQGDFRTWLPRLGGKYAMLFADPPDNIGWSYSGYEDALPPDEYRGLLSDTLRLGTQYAGIFWMSFNVNNLCLVADLVGPFDRDPEFSVRWIMQTFTFGTCLPQDFSRCFRPLVRIMPAGVTMHYDAIRVTSARQRAGDRRADPRGKIPSDVWEFPRVVGNSSQRRPWHSTQLHEALYERCIKASATAGDRIGDLFAGSGTIARAAKGLSLDVSMFEQSEEYCHRLSEEHTIPIHKFFPELTAQDS